MFVEGARALIGEVTENHARHAHKSKPFATRILAAQRSSATIVMELFRGTGTAQFSPVQYLQIILRTDPQATGTGA